MFTITLSQFDIRLGLLVIALILVLAICHKAIEAWVKATELKIKAVEKAVEAEPGKLLHTVEAYPGKLLHTIETEPEKLITELRNELVTKYDKICGDLSQRIVQLEIPKQP